MPSVGVLSQNYPYENKDGIFRGDMLPYQYCHTF